MNVSQKMALAQGWNSLILESESNELLTMLLAKASKHCDGISEWDAVDFIINDIGLTTVFSDARRSSCARQVREDIKEVSTKQRWGLSGSKPKSFLFRGTMHLTSSWCELVHMFCCMVFEDNVDRFARVLKIQGKSRYYFSKAPSKLDNDGGKLISDSGIFVVSNLNADNSYALVNQVHAYFGYGPTLPIQCYNRGQLIDMSACSVR